MINLFLILIDDERGSDDLLKVTLNVVATETCNISYRNDRTVFSRGIVDNLQLCAGEVNKDTCQVNFKFNNILNNLNLLI